MGGFVLINKYSNIPLYSQLKQLILEKIENDEYQENSKIPSEQEFCEIYDISRPTVRQAINELTSSGAIYKLKGKGTFVSKAKNRIDIKDYSGFSDSLLDSEIPGEKEIIGISITSNKKLKKLNEIFGIAPSPSVENEFAVIQYITKRDGEVFSLNVSYIPIYLFPDIVDDVKNKKPSYDILKGKYPLLPSTQSDTLISLSTILAPICASLCAIDFPRPLPAPVTTAVLPFNCIYLPPCPLKHLTFFQKYPYFQYYKYSMICLFFLKIRLTLYQDQFQQKYPPRPISYS